MLKKLQQRNYILVVENEFIKEENEQLKRQIEKLKLQEEYLMQSDKIKCESIYQLKHKNKAQEKAIDRLITIITDEHYN